MNAPRAKALISRAETAPAYWQIGNLWRVMVTGVQSSNSFTLLDQIVTDGGGGGGPCTHTHAQDEGLYVVGGQCTFNAGGHDGMTATAGTFVSVPRLTEHSFTVDSPNTRLLNFYLPAGFDQLLTGIAHPAADRSDQAPPAGVPLPPAWLVEKLAEDYGQTAVLGMPFIDAAGADNMSTKPTPGATVLPYMAKAEESSTYWYQGGRWSVLATGAKTGNSYCLFEKLLPHGSSSRTPPQINDVADQVLYILDGKATVLLDDRIDTVGPHSLVFIPRGTVHAFRVDSPALLVLHLCTPAGYEKLLPVLAHEAMKGALPPTGFVDRLVEREVREGVMEEVGVRALAVRDPLG